MTVKSTGVPTLEADQPTNLDEANAWIAELGKEISQLTTIREKVNVRVAAIRAKETEKTKPLEDRVERLINGLHRYAEKNKVQLTATKKSVTLPSGILGWNNTPPAVEAADEQTVIKALQRRVGREGAITIKTVLSLNKTAIKKNPSLIKGIAGIAITQKEYFYVQLKRIAVQVSKLPDGKITREALKK